MIERLDLEALMWEAEPRLLEYIDAAGAGAAAAVLELFPRGTPCVLSPAFSLRPKLCRVGDAGVSKVCRRLS